MSRSIIHILSPEHASAIAAGEVIERPAHVLKELLDNAVDAGATSISIHISDAGKSMVRVVDDGCGMWHEDARKAVLPHATSKLRTLNDLHSLATFGFRGEALYTIAAVSKLTITTRHQQASEQEAGISLRYQGIILEAEEQYAGPAGSDITVQDLFFNVPVRKKFLKTDQTEWNALQQIVYAHALASRQIWFKLYHNQSLIINAPPVDSMTQRVAQLWSHEVADNLLTISSTSYEGFSVNGLISNTQLWRYGKQQLFFFVNNRWIKNQELSKGLLKGYERLLPTDKFPIAFVFVEIDPTQIDINIHPKKEEIRFLKPLWVQQQIAARVKETLEQSVNASPARAAITTPAAHTPSPYRARLPQEAFRQPAHSPTPSTFSRPTNTSFNSVLEEVFGSELRSATAPSATPSPTYLHPTQEPLPLTQPVESIYQATVSTETQAPIIIGQLFNTYLVVQHDNRVMIIDQHAAHERILYERYRTRFETMPRIALLFSATITLSKEECTALLPYLELLEQVGIGLRHLGPQQLLLEATPPDLHHNAIEEIIKQAAALLLASGHMDQVLIREKLCEHMHSHLACKAAIKAGDVLTTQQMQQLVEDLYTTPNRHMCIHGRPTTWTIEQEQVAKRFKRT